jgi:predicted nucleotidyltransferase
MSSVVAPAPSISVTLPEAARRRLEIAAQARGETVDKLMGELVERFLADERQIVPTLAMSMEVLRSHSAMLRQREIAALWVFGSVARGEARAGSDVDLLAEFDPSAKLSLVSLASLRATLSDWLGAPADLVKSGTLHPDIANAAKTDAVRVF